MFKCAEHFQNKGFPLYDIIEKMVPAQAKGTHVFRPGSEPSTPAPPSKAPLSLVPQTPAATTSQAAASAFAVQAATAHSDDISVPPSTSSSFLAPLDRRSNSSSVLTSVSRGKRKAGTISGSESVVNSAASNTSRKRIRGPSTASVQLEGVEVMKQISHMVDGISKAFASSGITITTNDVFQQAIAVLKTHEGDILVDDYLELAEYLTTPVNRQQAIIFAGLGDIACKRWVEKRLAEMAKKSA